MIENDLGIPSILVNAAGVFGPIDLIKNSDPAAWIETIMINTVSSYLTCRMFVGGMIDGGWPHCKLELNSDITRPRCHQQHLWHEQSGSQ